MNFSFSIIRNKKQCNLNLFISDAESSLTLGNKIFEETTDKFFMLLEEYQSHNGMGGITYDKRDLIQNVLKDSGTDDEIELLRILGCSSLLLRYNLKLQNDFVSDWLKSKIEKPESHIYNNKLYIDWKDELGPQPSIYYLTKELIDSDPIEVDKLFQLGLLGKLCVSDNNEYTRIFYFTSFIFPRISKFDYMIHRKMIESVMIEREKVMKKVGK